MIMYGLAGKNYVSGQSGLFKKKCLTWYMYNSILFLNVQVTHGKCKKLPLNVIIVYM